MTGPIEYHEECLYGIIKQSSLNQGFALEQLQITGNNLYFLAVFGPSIKVKNKLAVYDNWYVAGSNTLRIIRDVYTNLHSEILNKITLNFLTNDTD